MSEEKIVPVVEDEELTIEVIVVPEEGAIIPDEAPAEEGAIIPGEAPAEEKKKDKKKDK